MSKNNDKTIGSSTGSKSDTKSRNPQKDNRDKESSKSKIK